MEFDLSPQNQGFGTFRGIPIYAQHKSKGYNSNINNITVQKLSSRAKLMGTNSLWPHKGTSLSHVQI